MHYSNEQKHSAFFEAALLLGILDSPLGLVILPVGPMDLPVGLVRATLLYP